MTTEAPYQTAAAARLRKQLDDAATLLHSDLVHPNTTDLWPHPALRSACDECGRLLVALLQAGEDTTFQRYERIHSLLRLLAQLLGFELRVNPDPDARNPFAEMFGDELDQHYPHAPYWWLSDGPDRGSRW